MTPAAPRIPAPCSLTPTQRDIYLEQEQLGSLPVASLGGSVLMPATLDPASWEAAVRLVVQEEPILRSKVFLAEDGLMQRAEEITEPVVSRLGLIEEKNASSQARELTARCHMGTQGSHFLHWLAPTDSGRWLSVIGVSHVFSDGHSLRLLFERISSTYERLRQGERPPALRTPSFYEYLSSVPSHRLHAIDLDYWRQQLADVRPLSVFSEPSGSGEFCSAELVFSEGETSFLLRSCERLGCSLPGLLQQAYALALEDMRLPEKGDWLMQIMRSGRTHDCAQILGCFARSEPCVIKSSDFDADQSIADFLLRPLARRKETMRATRNMGSPSMQQQREMLPEGGLRARFNFYDFTAVQLPEETADLIVHTAQPENEIQLIAAERGGCLSLRHLHYTRWFSDEAFLPRLRHVIMQLADPSKTRLGEIDHLMPAEKQWCIENGTLTPKSSDPVSAVEAFVIQSRRTPQSIAVIDSREAWSYAELELRSRRVATHLAKAGAGAGSRVAILARRTPDMVAAALGVMRSGAAYIPLDPEYPAQRLSWMVRDAQAEYLLHHKDLTPPDLEAGTRCFLLEDFSLDITLDHRSLRTDPRPDDPAYFIYTSGSTGTPKGVVITHRNLTNFLNWAADTLGGDDLSGMLASTSLCFDLSIFELFAPLIRGGTVILAPNALALPELESADRVRILNTVPSAARELLLTGGLPKSLRTMVLAGEKLDQELVELLYAKEGLQNVFDCYGPSETTTYSTWTRRVRGGKASVGRPISNTRIYVVNSRGRLAPPCAAGEIWIGGAGVAAGYWNQRELTEERFPPDPFSSHELSGDLDSVRVFRTGDLGRWNSDGELEFLGRIDRQVKIRGFRVEPGETEAALRRHPSVLDATVQALEAQSGGLHLVAYVVPADSSSASLVSVLKEELSRNLPAQQLPAHFVFLEKLPLLPNGKLDAKSLTRLPLPVRESRAALPESATSRMVAAIWGEVLNLEPSEVCWEDNFFHIGGNSLGAMRVVWLARQRFRKAIALPDLFRHPTLGAFSVRVDALAAGVASTNGAPAACHQSREFKLHALQLPFWTLHAIAPEAATSHLAQVTVWKGKLDVPALERSLAAVKARHPMLRARIVQAEQGPGNRIDTEVVEKIPIEDLSGPGEGARDAWMREQQSRPFNLSSGPLCRFALARVGPDEHVFACTFHHLIMDEWSLGIASRDLGTAYTAFARGELPSFAVEPGSYDQHVREMALRFESGLTRHLGYWRRRMKDAPALRLPEVSHHPHRLCGPGAVEVAVLPVRVVNQLRALGCEENATLFVTMQAAFFCLLYRWTGQEDMVLGTAMANRSADDSEATVGLFVNLVPIRVRASTKPTFRTLLRRVRAAMTQAMTHQEVPHTLIAAEAGMVSRPGTASLFQMVFNHMDASICEIPLPGLASQAIPVDPLDCTYDLSAYALEQEDGVQLRMVYRRDVVAADVIQSLCQAMTNLAEALVMRPDENISRLRLFGEMVQPAASRIRPSPRARYVHFDEGAASGTLTCRLQEQARVHGNSLAVTDGKHRWSYHELLSRLEATAVAIAAAVDWNRPRVALLCQHDAAMTAAVLGTLRSGCAYVPLDPQHPAERWRMILEDGDVGLVLVDESMVRKIRPIAINCRVITLSDTKARVVLSELPPDPDPESPAYILYTSGSTGRPKGVVQNHRNVLHHVRMYSNQLRLDAGDRMAMLASYGFDASVMDLYGALLNGASLHLFDIHRHGLAMLTEWMESEKITVLHTTPSIYRAWLETLGGSLAPASIRLVVLGGEEVLATDFDKFRRHFSRGCVFVNGLGPTESTLALQHFLNHESSLSGNRVPVGSPVPGTEVLLLDEEGMETEIFGEIALRSQYLALGYWRQEDLTRERFFPPHNGDGPRTYRTGDLGRRLPDGTFLYGGRIDQQVKIRGVRIELGEIEACLCLHENVRQAVVHLERNEPRTGGEHVLNAYVVAESQPPPSTEQLRSLLVRRLPQAMVPRSFTILDELPRNANGKVDRRRLPQPDWPRPRPEASRQHLSATEATLIAIWREVLALEAVGPDEDFFELGGQSLKALEAIARMNRALGRNESVRSLFENPTCRQWAASIEQIPAAWPDELEQDIRHLVHLRGGTDETTLFVVPGGWGGDNEMLVFAGLLSHAGIRGQVYGFISGILHANYRAPESVETLAERYVRELIASHHGGDFLLAGECVGGLVALEMARQLSACGRPPRRTILLDTKFPTEGDAQNLRRTGRAQFTQSHGEELGARVFSYYNALYAHPPRYWDGDIVLLVSQETLSAESPGQGWQTVFGDRLAMREVPGDHHTYIREHRAQTGRILGEMCQLHPSQHGGDFQLVPKSRQG